MALIAAELQVRQSKGDLPRQWKHYWCVLTKTSVQYFESKDSKQPLTTIQISQIDEVENVMEKKGNDDMIFEIKTSDNRRTQHACDSVAQLDSWIYQIDKAKTGGRDHEALSLSDSEDSQEDEHQKKKQKHKKTRSQLKSSGTSAGSDDEGSSTGTVEIKKSGDSFKDHISELKLADRKKYWTAMTSDDLKRMIAGDLLKKYKSDCQARLDSWAESRQKLLEALRKAQLAEVNKKIDLEIENINETRKKLEKKI